MANIKIRVDLQPLAKCFRYISDETKTFAIADAIQRGTASMRTEARRAIPDQARTIKSPMVSKATRITTSKTVGTLWATDNWLHAWSSRSKLNARQGKAGARFRPWDNTVTTKGSFKATMANGMTSIFVRSTSNRFPIHHIGFGPSVHREMVRQDKPAGDRILIAGRERFNTRVVQNVSRVTKAGKARFGL